MYHASAAGWLHRGLALHLRRLWHDGKFINLLPSSISHMHAFSSVMNRDRPFVPGRPVKQMIPNATCMPQQARKQELACHFVVLE